MLMPRKQYTKEFKARSAAPRIMDVPGLPSTSWRFEYQTHQFGRRRTESHPARMDLGAFGSGR